MALTPSIGTCQSELIIPEAFPITNPPTQLQFFIGATPITGVMLNVQAANVGLFNLAVSVDPTYIAWNASTGGNINGTLYDFQGLHVTITTPSTSQISDLAIATFVNPVAPIHASFEAPFICNIPPSPKPKPRKRGGALNNAFDMLPVIQCFKKQRDVNGNLIPCQNRLKLFGGVIYILDSNNSDDKKCCYVKTNLSQ